MDWKDDEAEAFLRRFRPIRPRALPNRRRTLIAVALAAAAVLAVVVPVRFSSTESGVTDESARASTSKPPTSDGAEARERIARVVATDSIGSPAIASDVPALSPLGRPPRPGPPPSARPPTTAGAAQKRIRVGGAIKPPRRLVNVNPIYPEEAQAAGVQGTVVLAAVIGVDGTVIEAEVIESVPELDQAAIDAVLQWEYETTLLNGEPVEVELTVTINFTLT